MLESQLSIIKVLQMVVEEEVRITRTDVLTRCLLLLRSPLATKADQYCLGIRNGGSTGFIIGDTTMRNYYVVFDKAQRRIGWGKVNKETCGSK